MNFKTLLDEALSRGEKIKSDIVHELFKSKTIQEIVTNKNFIHAISRLIETKDEIKKVIGRQAKSVFDMMDVPTKNEFKRIGMQLSKLEKWVDHLGRRRIAVKALHKPVTRKTTKKSVRKISRKKR